MARETADDIDEAAASWAARADRGLSAAERAELEIWLGGDVRRSGAYARMTWALMSTERPDTALEGVRAPRRATRRRWLAAGGALAAGMAGVGVYLGSTQPVAYATRKGEKKVVSLDDGSVITLNTSTRLQVRYAKDRRAIHLLEGEALFDVAKDRDRPFVVTAGNAYVRAVGTSFTVSSVSSGAPVQVVVREGVVDVARTDLPRQPPARVKANYRVILARDNGVVDVAHVDEIELGSDLAWKDGQIIFRGETLAAAAVQFGRYSDIRIVIGDPELGAEKVAGVFNATDPVGFARSMALSLNAKVEIRAEAVRLSR